MTSVPNKKTERINMIKIRKENFGGVIFDSFTTAIYKVDSDGYRFIELLKAGEKVEKIGKKMKLPQKECRDFVNNLIEFGIW